MGSAKENHSKHFSVFVNISDVANVVRSYLVHYAYLETLQACEDEDE